MYPFNSMVFRIGRDAREAITKKLQADPCKRKSSSVSSEVTKIILQWYANLLDFPRGITNANIHQNSYTLIKK